MGREKSKWKSTCIIIVITFLITPLIGFGATQNVTELPENVTLVENVPEFNEPQPENITNIPEPITTILSELEDVTNITAPIITIRSPENTTYATTLIGLNYTINKPTDWVGYSLNGANNVTITGNITFYAPGGLNHLVLYAADTAGNSGTAEVQFNVNVTDSLGITPKLSAKKDFFAVDEEPAFTFEYKTFNKSFIKNASAQTFNESFIGSISESESGIAALGEPQKAFKRWKTANETIEAFVYDYSGKLTDIVPEIERIQEGTFEIKLLKERAFRAGVYKLEVELVQDERVYVVEKEFPWGLVSLNTRKSIYKPGETAEFVIVVLDEEGHSVCDANISMIVTNPNDEKTGYCTCAGTILPGEECGLYTANYLTEVEGNHTVNITAKIGVREINRTWHESKKNHDDKSGCPCQCEEESGEAGESESCGYFEYEYEDILVNFSTYFLVKEDYEFDIVREAQSKIDPKKQDWSDVTIDIESFTDAHSITIKEFVPAEFEISTTDATTVLGEDDTKTITWKKDLIGGKTSVNYSYSVPPVWPYLYALGPVEIEYNGNTFMEARAWYVAVDPEEMFWDLFPSTTLNATNWPVTDLSPTVKAPNRCTICEPSDPYILELNNQDGVTSKAIDLSGYKNINVSFWYCQYCGANSPEAGEMISLWYNASNGSWVKIWELDGGTNQNFYFKNITLTDAAHTGFKLKFNTTASSGEADQYEIDDVKVEAELANAAPTTPTNITCNGGSCNVTVDSSAVLQASGSTDADGDDITYFIEASLKNITTVQDTTNVQVTLEDPNIAATGGTTTETGGYKFHTFTSSGTFQVTSGSGNVELLVVGGGAGGGTGGTAGRGGGGAGGIVYSSAFPVSTGSYTVTVGGGGAPGADTSSTSGNGVNSSFNTLVAIGGGGAGPHATAGTAGGSGGGGSGYSGEAGGAGLQPGSASGGYGNAGGASYNGGAAPGRQGGGAGAGAAGQNGQSTSGGNGGVGLQFSQFASVGGSPAGWFGGGGGGGASSGQGAGSGGQGGGGAGSSSGVGTSGTANTGGGGGGATSTGGSGGSGIVIVRYPTGGGTSNETNTSATTYNDVDSNYILINNITVKVEVDSYDPAASVKQSTKDPDLYLEMYNGSAWIGIGEFHLNDSYIGDTLNTTNANFSLTTTDSTILTAWQTSTNQDLRIKGIYMDWYNSTTIDEINYTNVWVTINGTSWTAIGNHSASSNFTWNTTGIAEQTCIDLRARAIDLAGSNTYSAYYTKGCCLNIGHEAPTYSNDQDDSGGSVNEGTKVNVSVYWDDDVALSKGILRTNKTGTWQNETPWNDFTATPQWFNTTIDTSGCGGGTICWVQWANDTSNNWNTSMSTTAHCFTVIEVDSTPPLITDENLNRTELNTGETIRLNATTSDPESDVTSIEFSIKYSNGTSANFSATEISTNYWEYNFSDTSQPGQYNWTDTYATSAGGTNHTTPSLTFIVYDITPPVPSNMSTNETAAGSPCLFSAYWTDNVGLANYTFAWNDTGEWVNDSIVDFSGTGNWSNVTKPLNSTPKTIGWRIYANDTSGNLNDTGIQLLTLKDATKPVPSNISTNATAAKRPCLFSAYWTDNVGLANYTFAWNDTGEWVNESAVNFSGTGNWSNVTKPLNSTLKTIGWRIYANDTSGNLNDTGIQLLTIQANEAPTTPTSITCDGGDCDINIDTGVTLNASGSTDPDGDAITYVIEALLQNVTIVENTTDINLIASGGGFITSIESCPIQIANPATSNTYTLTKGQNASNVVPFSSYYISTVATTADDYSAYVHDITISGSTVTATRNDAGGATIDLQLYLVEFNPNQVRVQNGTFSMSGTSTTASIPISVNQSKSFLIFYYKSADTAVQQPEFNVRGYFSANNQLTFTRGAGTGTTSGHWYVVEDLGNNFNVQAKDITLTGAASNTGTLSPAVQMNKTMLVGSYQGGSSDDVIHGSVGAYLSSTTQVTVIRGGTTSNIASTVYAITFTGDEYVQRASQAFTTSQSALSAPLDALDYSNAIASSAMRLTDDGRVTSGGTASSDNPDPKVRLVLDDGNDEIDFTRSINGGNDAVVDWEVINFSTGGGESSSSDTNTTETTYNDVDSDYDIINNIAVKVEVDSYNPEASVQQATNDPDLYLEMYNGSAWIGIGEFHLNDSYTGDTLNTTNANFSLTTTYSSILTAWQTSTNQDLRIKGIYMDYYNSTTIDEINYTNVWVTINSKNWTEIGNHSESTTLDWNTTDIAELMCINLRARAIDLAGSNTYSDYYTKECCLNIYRWNDCNVTWISPPDPSEYTLGNTITLTCLVRDATTSAPIENYPVHFYNRTDSTVTYDFGVNYTNSSGYAVMDWATTGVAEEGWYYPKCNITDNATLLYHATAPYEANTSINLSYIKTLEIRNQAASQGITSINVSGSGGETIINPYNDVDGSGSAQNTGTTTPVVTIYNPPSSTEYKIWLKVEGGTGWDYIVTDEKFNVTADGTDPGDVSTWTSLRLEGSWGTFVDTREKVAQGTYKDLYLAFLLNGSGTGNATISVLGEVA
jgi:hypothetical protein